MEDRGIVQPAKSPWANAIVLMTKRDGTTCFCVEYRKLNAVTKVDACLLSCIDDTLAMLSGQRFYQTGPGVWILASTSARKREDSFQHTSDCTNLG